MTTVLAQPTTCVLLENGVKVPLPPHEIVVLWQQGDLPFSVPEDLIGQLPRHKLDGLPLGTRVLMRAYSTWLGGRICG